MDRARKIEKTDTEWREQLSPEQYRVLRQAGTERPFTGEFNEHHEAGTYVCAGCGTPLFPSETKFDSHCGWPAFYRPAEGTVEEHLDTSHGMVRTEVLCEACGGHLGHVFEDSPQTPTGLRYCINSASLQFQPETP